MSKFDDLLLPHSFIDIQWFATAEEEGRTHDATDQKKRKAREEGNVAKSADLTSAVVLIFGLVCIAALSSFIVTTLKEMMEFYYSEGVQISLTNSSSLYSLMLVYFLKIMVPIFVILFLVAFFANVFQVGFMFVTKPIVPDFTKVAFKFDKFIERAFISNEARFNLLKTLGKVILIGAVASSNIWLNIERLLSMIALPLESGLLIIVKLAFSISMQVAILLLLISIPDFYFQKKKYEEKLKMTIQEVKDEFKESEGDPQVKAMIKEKQQQLLSMDIPEVVKSADVVITNPTHYAIVLKYDRKVSDVPLVTCKGKDHFALKIKKIAREQNVEVIENRQLARNLYATTEIGEGIPVDTHEVVAQILSLIYKRNEKVVS